MEDPAHETRRLGTSGDESNKTPTEAEAKEKGNSVLKDSDKSGKSKKENKQGESSESKEDAKGSQSGASHSKNADDDGEEADGPSFSQVRGKTTMVPIRRRAAVSTVSFDQDQDEDKQTSDSAEEKPTPKKKSKWRASNR